MLWPREEFLNLASDCLVRTYFRLYLSPKSVTNSSYESNLLCPHLPSTNFNQPVGDKPGSEEGPSDFSDNSQSKLKSAILDLEYNFQTSGCRSGWRRRKGLAQISPATAEVVGSQAIFQCQSSSSCAPQLSSPF